MGKNDLLDVSVTNPEHLTGYQIKQPLKYFKVTMASYPVIRMEKNGSKQFDEILVKEIVTK